VAGGDRRARGGWRLAKSGGGSVEKQQTLVVYCAFCTPAASKGLDIRPVPRGVGGNSGGKLAVDENQSNQGPWDGWRT
jgi:hypothetical protein